MAGVFLWMLIRTRRLFIARVRDCSTAGQGPAVLLGLSFQLLSSESIAPFLWILSSFNSDINQS